MQDQHKELSAHILFGQHEKAKKFYQIKYAKDDNFYDIDDVDLLPVYGGDKLASNFTKLGLKELLMSSEIYKDRLLISYLTNGKYFSLKLYTMRVIKNTLKLYASRNHIFKKKYLIEFWMQKMINLSQ